MEIVKQIPREKYFRETERTKKILENLECPFCGSKELVSLVFQGTFCKKCNSRIELTPTTENGYTIKVDPSSIWEKESQIENPQEIGVLLLTIKDHYYAFDKEEIEIIWHDKKWEKQHTQKIPCPL